jgi:hypothetical protein
VTGHPFPGFQAEITYLGDRVLKRHHHHGAALAEVDGLRRFEPTGDFVPVLDFDGDRLITLDYVEPFPYEAASIGANVSNLIRKMSEVDPHDLMETPWPFQIPVLNSEFHVKLVNQVMRQIKVPKQKPVPAHGDLWQGNIIMDADGVLRLIDPIACLRKPIFSKAEFAARVVAYDGISYAEFEKLAEDMGVSDMRTFSDLVLAFSLASYFSYQQMDWIEKMKSWSTAVETVQGLT